MISNVQVLQNSHLMISKCPLNCSGVGRQAHGHGTLQTRHPRIAHIYACASNAQLSRKILPRGESLKSVINTVIKTKVLIFLYKCK